MGRSINGEGKMYIRKTLIAAICGFALVAIATDAIAQSVCQKRLAADEKDNNGCWGVFVNDVSSYKGGEAERDKDYVDCLEGDLKRKKLKAGLHYKKHKNYIECLNK